MSTVAESIKLILVKRNMSLKALSKEAGISPNSMYAKINNNNGEKFKISELESIAQVLDCTFECSFTLNDTKEKF